MSNINSPKKNTGDGGWFWSFLIVGLFLLIYSFWPKDKLIYFFLLLGVIFIAVIVYLNRLFRSETKKIESETFEKAKVELEFAKDETEKEILSKYVDSKRLEQERRVLEPIVDKLSIKAERTDNKEIQEQYISKKVQLDDIEAQLSSAYYDADEGMSEEQIAAFKKVIEAYDLLKKSRMIWEVLSKYKYSESERDSSATHGIDRSAVNFSSCCGSGSFLGIRTQFEIPQMKDSSGNYYYLYPKFIIKTKGASSFSVIPLSPSIITFRITRLAEDEKVPSDSKIVDLTWKHVNKNGKPDKRYSYNPRVYILEYGTLQSERLGVVFMVSNSDATKEFVRQLANYISSANLLPSSDVVVLAQGITPINNVSMKYFEDVRCATNNIKNFIEELIRDKKFHEIISTNVNAEIIVDGKPVDDVEGVIKYLSFVDVVRCYQGLGYPIDINRSEALGLIFYALYAVGNDIDFEYEQLDNVLEQLKDSGQKYFSQFETTNYTSSTDSFLIVDILKFYDDELLKKYSILLYRFTSIIAKADNTINEEEAKWLDKILSLKDSGGNTE